MLRPLVFSILVLAVAACGGNGLGGGDCDAGNWRCSGNTAQLCNSDEEWENYQNCSAVNQQCTTSSSRCSGFSIACCD
jgi:hypothetical protein